MSGNKAERKQSRNGSDKQKPCPSERSISCAVFKVCDGQKRRRLAEAELRMSGSLEEAKRKKGWKRSGNARESDSQPHISGDNSLRVPPVPIPNTEVKPQHADGTWLATARESRSSPDSILP